MNTSKIKSCSFKKEYDSKYGTFYSHKIELEDGVEGEISAKSQNPDYLQPGKELTYEVKSENDYGKKLKRVTPQGGGGGGFKGSSGKSYDDIGATVGNALTNAVKMYCAGKLGSDDKEAMKKIKPTTEWLAQIAIETKKKLKSTNS